MSKKNTKSKKFSPYKKYGYDRNAAKVWNDHSYEYWCMCDEGQDYPDPYRLTNFLFKYGRKHKKTGKSILSYIPNDYMNLILPWIRMSKSERKKVRKYEPNAGKKIISWLHHAEIIYWDDINNYRK